MVDFGTYPKESEKGILLDKESSWRTDLEASWRRTEDLSGICARSLSPFDGGGAPTLFSHQFLRSLHPQTNPSSALTPPQTLHFEQRSRSALYKELLGPVWHSHLISRTGVSSSPTSALLPPQTFHSVQSGQSSRSIYIVQGV